MVLVEFNTYMHAKRSRKKNIIIKTVLEKGLYYNNTMKYKKQPSLHITIMTCFNYN